MRQVRIKGVGRLRVNIQTKSKGHLFSRMVKTNGVLSGDALCNELGIKPETLSKMIEGVIRIVRAGYEVRLGTNEDAIRLYPLLDKDCEGMYLCAQTIGNVRHSIGDLGFDLFHNGEVVSDDELNERISNVRHEIQEKRKMICVTPDTIVECPECGTTIRVGKVLAANKEE